MIIICIAVAIVGIVIVLWYTVRILELIFFAVLGAIFLRGIGGWLAKWSRLPLGLSIAVVIFILLALFGTAIWMLSPHVQEQINKMGHELPQAIDKIQRFIEKAMGGMGVRQNAGEKLLGNLGTAVGKIREFFAITLEVAEDFIIFFFLTLYLAFNPDIYIRGIIKLVPVKGREAASDIIQALGSTLKWWLIGRFATMTLVGIMSGLGLWLLGIPLALTLGILAGLLTFIPYIGAIISSLPAILIALLISVSHAVYVIFLYIGIHTVEGYILAPLIQERAVFVPPMLLLSALIGLTILLGVPGLIIATPLTAASLVLINKIYIERILGDNSESQS